MVGITLLLKRAFTFIVKIIILFRKLHKTNDHAVREKLQPPAIPKSILKLVQLE